MTPERYELVFADGAEGEEDVVIVSRTEYTGAGGHPVYVDPSGIVRAEISDQGEVRILASGAGQVPARVLRARALS
ncbi:DUF6296 family protein [Streptomyces sp. WAC06614]|uniref:DUF6296 family protein n=1 Tax=Streptomyces sp. WAC06614 TaxID=2487416 RepID=UPI000F7812B3|nr:DUF6296 family protein [Streptomyces sp. WAC06614]RSS78327.1 hypothetical protein EF918_21330 [Streptomyces sp. WAC06614]